MKTITAKFSSLCPTCNQRIAVGAQIEWEKGRPAVHTVCPPAGDKSPLPVKAARPVATASQRAPRSPAFPLTAPEPGAIQIQGRRTDRSDVRYSTGEVLHAPKVREAGGGPDGHYYTILAAKLSPPNEDNQQFAWTEYAWVRPATDAEAAPAAARVTTRALRDALVLNLGVLRGERVSGPMPQSAGVLVPVDPTKRCVTGERVAIVDGAILHERVGDPDMMDSIYHYIVRIEQPAPELLARVQTFLGGAA